MFGPHFFNKAYSEILFNLIGLDYIIHICDKYFMIPRYPTPTSISVLVVTCNYCFWHYRDLNPVYYRLVLLTWHALLCMIFSTFNTIFGLFFSSYHEFGLQNMFGIPRTLFCALTPLPLRR